MAKTDKRAGKPAAAEEKPNGATLGFETKLWQAADKMRNNMDAAEYKHVVLGLIFLKYISDAFEEKRAALEAEKKSGADAEDPDEYRADNIFWVPKEARWPHLQGKANSPWPLVLARSVFELKYGKALVEGGRRSGGVPVFGTNGQCGWHDSSLFSGPGVVLGRKGQGPLGVEWVKSDYWVIDTAYALNLLRDDVDLKYAYYLIKYVGLTRASACTSTPSCGREWTRREPERASAWPSARLGTGTSPGSMKFASTAARTRSSTNEPDRALA